MTSSNPDAPSRWWAFTLPRPSKHDPPSSANKPERKPLKQGSMSITWRPKEIPSFSKRTEKIGEESNGGQHPRDWNLSIAIPPTAQPSFTLSQNHTPGWETPWTSRPDAQGPTRRSADEHESDYGLNDEESLTRNSIKHGTPWKRRKRLIRTFVLTNQYIPLVSTP